ncbi:hypothetical protein ACNKHP_11350 [Shigella boydii]
MFTIGKDPVVADQHEWLNATLFAVRGIVSWSAGYVQTVPSCARTRQVYYLSMERLIGRTLSNAMLFATSAGTVQGALE